MFIEKVLLAKELINVIKPPSQKTMLYFIDRTLLNNKASHSYVAVTQHCVEERGRKAKKFVRNL